MTEFMDSIKEYAWVVVGVTVLIVVAAVAVGVISFILKMRKLSTTKKDKGLVCKCGYNLTGVEIPQCPECGNAIGFDQSLESLGIDEQEVRQLRRAREERDEGVS